MLVVLENLALELNGDGGNVALGRTQGFPALAMQATSLAASSD
jgi:hypothetical protein